MTGYALHPGALGDIEQIWEYIFEDNPDAADRVVAEIFEACGSLIPQPDQGHWREDFAPRTIRFKRVRSYLIAYTPEATPLRVLAVFHGRRNPRLIASIVRGRSAGW